MNKEEDRDFNYELLKYWGKFIPDIPDADEKKTYTVEYYIEDSDMKRGKLK